MSSTTEKIKDRLSIVDVISGYITIEKSGANFKARCPFHNEKTPSLFISPERGTFYCFGCGEKGDIFSFVEKIESVDFVGALKILAEKSGVQIESFDKEEGKNKKILECLEEACVFFQYNLKENKDALLYIKSRGLSIESLNKWRIGFAKQDWRTLKDYLKKKGFSENVLEEAGLIKSNPDAKESYDRFRGRIMFPIFDSAGRVVGFSGRIFDSQKKDEAKYLNSPETPVFLKSKILYGYNFAKHSIRELSEVVLVEGQMDLIMSVQSGVLNTVATSGTAFTLDQATTLKRLSETLVIAYDADVAGQNASMRAWKIALQAGFKIKVAKISSGKDPADLVKENPQIWIESVKQADDIVDYFCNSLRGKDNEEKDKIIRERILPIIKSILSPIDQARAIEKVSFESGLSEKVIRQEIDLLKEVNDDNLHFEEKEKVKKVMGSARKAILMLLFLETSNHRLKDDFRNRLENILDEKISFNTEDVDAMKFEAESFYSNSPNIGEASEELLYLLEEEILKQKLQQSMENIKQLEKIGDKENIIKELNICHNISKKLSGLKKFK